LGGSGRKILDKKKEPKGKVGLDEVYDDVDR